MGDVVFTLPAVSAVKAAFPEAKLSFLIYREFAPLLEGFPHIDSVIELDRSRFRGLKPWVLAPAALRLLSRLRAPGFNLVVDFQGFGETGLLSWWSRAANRWGGVYRPGRGWPYTRAIRREPNLHAVDYQLDLLERAGGITHRSMEDRFQVPETAMAKARALFLDWQLSQTRATLFIQPFSNGDHKNWPLEGYLAVASHWKEQGGQVLFGGGPADRAALEPARQRGYAVAAGAPLLVSAALANLSSVVLGGDTGLLHLATAMGKRVVMVISSIAPGNCFPYQHPDWAVAPTPGTMITTVTPAMVIEACARAIAELPKCRPAPTDAPSKRLQTA